MSQIRRGETERARYWGRMVAAWERSGLTQSEFCRRRGVSPITFSCWKGRRLGPGNDAGQVTGRRAVAPGVGRTRGSFVELRLAEGAACRSGYEIALSRGRVIRLPADFEADAVSRLITAVESC